MEQIHQSQSVDETARLLEAKLRLESKAKNGAAWFYWIAGLSILNSIILIAGGSFAFIFGLAITQLIDAVAVVVETDLGINRPSVITFIALGLDLIIAAVFVGIGYAARKRNQIIYMSGIGLYAVDALLCIFIQYWLGILFHLFAIAGLLAGIKAIRTLAPVEAGTASLEMILPKAETRKGISISVVRIVFFVLAGIMILSLAIFLIILFSYKAG